MSAASLVTESSGAYHSVRYKREEDEQVDDVADRAGGSQRGCASA